MLAIVLALGMTDQAGDFAQVVHCDVLEINSRIYDDDDEPTNYQLILWRRHQTLGYFCAGWYWVREIPASAVWHDQADGVALSWTKNGLLYRIETGRIRYSCTRNDPEVAERRLMRDTIWGDPWRQLFR